MIHLILHSHDSTMRRRLQQQKQQSSSSSCLIHKYLFSFVNVVIVMVVSLLFIMTNNNPYSTVHSFTIHRTTTRTRTGYLKQQLQQLQQPQQRYSNRKENGASLLLELQQKRHKQRDSNFLLSLSTASSIDQPSINLEKSSSSSSLDILLSNIQTLTNQGSDIRGSFIHTNIPVNHDENTNIHHNLSSLIPIVTECIQQKVGKVPALTPYVAYLFGYAFTQQQILQQQIIQNEQKDDDDQKQHQPIIWNVVIGHDSRVHGVELTNAFVQGIQAYVAKATTTTNNNNDVVQINIQYAGLVTTPACAAFCRMGFVNAAVMITASHLPSDRNGFKLFYGPDGTGYTKPFIKEIGTLATEFLLQQQQQQNVVVDNEEQSTVPQQVQESEKTTVDQNDHMIPCEYVLDWMTKYYATSLKEAIVSKVLPDVHHRNEDNEIDKGPLSGLTIVLNAGNGAGGFFANVLNELGATCVECSLYLQPDGTFPNGVPNPELDSMITTTHIQCELVNADLGILLDTDADRCGFVVPTTSSTSSSASSSGVTTTFEPLNRNRLIALLSVISASEAPGCAIVTDSVTSEGLNKFLVQTLGLHHIRYLKGYANVINKAKDVTNSGEYDVKMAIETSGHCAMQENGYLDDGTYTAVQIISLLARQKQSTSSSTASSSSLLDLISELEEQPIVNEIRLTTIDGSLSTMNHIFDVLVQEIETMARNTSTSNTTLSWTMDDDNLEGIRVRFGRKGSSGQFFMVRKSLHDPIISIQIEANSIEGARTEVIIPLLQVLQQQEYNEKQIDQQLDVTALLQYGDQ